MQYLIGAAALLALITLGGCAWGFSAQQPDDYAKASPQFIPSRALAGRYLSEGIIYDYTGRVKAQFKAEMVGEFTNDGGRLTEHFVYASGREDHREWTLTFLDEKTFTATAPDLIGEARGVASGNSLSMTYKLRLNEAAGGHVVSVTDWMYLSDEGTIINRSQMRKFGIKVAELIAVFKHRDLKSEEFSASLPERAE